MLARGDHAFGAFVPPEVAAAIAYGAAPYDGLVFEAEHQPWDVSTLRDCLQYLLDRRQILESGSLAPAVTPLVRIPPNGGERAQWHAKQALDIGAFGIVWPHITSVEDARNAVAACRYPSRPDADRHDPAGVRGDGPVMACRYWGVSGDEYYHRADVWPLSPDGELLVAIMIESLAGIDALPEILDRVPGIGLVLVGEGELSQELGVPRQYEHACVVAGKRRILDACAERGIAAGHPHVTADNVERVIADGYRFLMSAPVMTYPGLEHGRRLTGRAAPATDARR